MRTTRLLLLATVLALTVAPVAPAMGPLPPSQDLRNLAITALSDDQHAAKEAVAALRAAGPEGLRAMRFQFRPEIAKAMAGTVTDDAAWRRLRVALDAVAAQRDAHASGLYWYTDIEQAKAAARESGKPILSLRLLGTLDSEFSCANSRFFRTALYANHSVSRYLQTHFVLHWKSVRPVPRVTIDMGDGRKFYRTITGNSIHYVLDAEGRPVDAVPGLYGPEAFVRSLRAAVEIEGKTRGLNTADRANALAAWHGERVRLIDDRWGEDLRALGVLTMAAPLAPPAVIATADANREAALRLLLANQPKAPDARMAGRLALGKGAVERPLVDAIAVAGNGNTGTLVRAPVAPPAVAPQQVQQPRPAAPRADVAGRLAGTKALAEIRIVNEVVAAAPAPPSVVPPAAPRIDLAAATPADLWPRIAERHAADARLDNGSKRLMRSKFPAATVAASVTPAKRDVEDPLVRVVANFERSVAEDTVRNEYTFHRQIHIWFAQQQTETADVDALNSRVYAELFLTPDSDPWLGLKPADTYSALQDDGMTEACMN